MLKLTNQNNVVAVIFVVAIWKMIHIFFHPKLRGKVFYFFINKNYEQLFAQLETCPSSSNSKKMREMAPRFSSEFSASPWIISFFLAFHFLFSGKFSLKLIALNCYLFCKTESSLPCPLLLKLALLSHSGWDKIKQQNNAAMTLMK